MLRLMSQRNYRPINWCFANSHGLGISECHVDMDIQTVYWHCADSTYHCWNWGAGTWGFCS
jgi:hypothetical protein